MRSTAVLLPCLLIAVAAVAAPPDTRWESLGSDDPAIAARTLAALLKDGEAALALVAPRLKLTRVDAAAIAGLIAQLDSDRYRLREQAHRELELLGDAAAKALGQAAAQGSEEVRVRAGLILEQIDTPRVADARRRQIARGIALLGRVGSPEARKVLARLAGGDPGAFITVRAQRALAGLQDAAANATDPSAIDRVALSSLDLGEIALLDNLPGILRAQRWDGAALLHVAAAQGRLDLLTLLEAWGVDPSLRDAAGGTALHAAVLYAPANAETVVRRLLKAGADPQAKDLRGLTAMHVAVMTRRDDLLQAFLDTGISKPADGWAVAAALPPVPAVPEEKTAEFVEAQDAIDRGLQEYTTRFIGPRPELDGEAEAWKTLYEKAEALARACEGTAGEVYALQRMAALQQCRNDWRKQAAVYQAMARKFAGTAEIDNVHFNLALMYLQGCHSPAEAMAWARRVPARTVAAAGGDRAAAAAAAQEAAQLMVRHGQLLARCQAELTQWKRIDDGPWGALCDDVRARLRIEPREGREPVFVVDLHNVSSRVLLQVHGSLRVEVDGRWYRHRPGANSDPSRRMFGPDALHARAEGFILNRHLFDVETDKPLELRPGKHRIRAAVELPPAPWSGGKPVRVVTNALEWTSP